MSYILNALRKSEIERQGRPEESLQDKLLQTKSVEQKRNAGVMVLLVLNLSLLIYVGWIFFMTPIETVQPVKPQKMAPVVKSIVKKNEAITVKPKDRMSVSEKQASIASLIKIQRLKPIEPEAINKPKKTSKKFSPVDIKKQTNDKSLAEADVTKEIAYLSELPASIRRAFPYLNINVYGYSENLEERFILVDMEKYHPGDRLPSGLMIKEIRKDSMVVEYKNRTVKVRP